MSVYRMIGSLTMKIASKFNKFIYKLFVIHYFLGNNQPLSRSIIIIPPRTCNQEILNPKISVRIAHTIVAKVGITMSVAIASETTLISSVESVILSLGLVVTLWGHFTRPPFELSFLK